MRNTGNKEYDTEYSGATNANSLPKIMDPLVTMAAVHRYVEQERIRSRRLLLWTGTVFFFILFLVLAVFTVIGIVVMKHIRRSGEAINTLRVQSALQSAEVISISNSLSRLEDGTVAVRKSLNDQEAARVKERQSLYADLKRFSEWVERRASIQQSPPQDLLERIQRLEREHSEREKEISQLREQNAALLALLAKSVEKEIPASVSAVNLDQKLKIDMPTQPLSSYLEAQSIVHNDVVKKAELNQSQQLPIQSKKEAAIKVINYPNGDRYEGEFKNGLMDGWGVYYFRNGDRYEGEFKADLKSGRGTYVSSTGDVYIGDFEGDVRNGRGSLTFANGDRYVGDFKDNTMNGKGTMIYANGNQYTGDFKNGQKHGFGTFTFANGDLYTGEYLADLRHGQGTYIFAGGAKYIGEFKNDKREGSGRYVYANGEEYIGEFKNGMKHGYGLSKYPNGLQIKGVWKEDRFLYPLDE